VPQLSFFVGKGGVGKTTVSAAFAVHTAVRNPKKKVILLSTDPAHSTADMLEVRVAPGTKPTRVRLPKPGNLSLWQIDAESLFRNFLSPYRDPVLQLIESGTLFTKEEIEPLLDSTLPGMAEVSGLLAIHELLQRGDYDHIVVDTAPIGHTLRLFELPQHFQQFLDFLDLAGSRDQWLAQRFGGRSAGIKAAFVDHWQQMVSALIEALASEESQVAMVTSPEIFSLNEAVRTADQLEGGSSGLKVGSLILNRVVTQKSKCKRCNARAETIADAQRFLKKNFPRVPVLMGDDPGQPLLGASSLLAFGESVFAKRPLRLTGAPPKSFSAKFTKAEWPALATQLSFTVGKGGVGKTTTSASLAFAHHRTHADSTVIVCSTDPAPSLDDVFETEIGNKPTAVLGDKRFFAMEVDSVAEYKRWSGAMQQKIENAFSTGTASGIQVDMSFDRQIFSALLDIVPPGVDEIFAVFRILDLLEQSRGQGNVLIDMAPTGHALELLRMPERILHWTRLLLKTLAQHRTLSLAQDVAVEVAQLGARIRELLKRVQDGNESRAYAVMLAEPVPDAETRRLLAALKEVPISVGALFVNRVLIEPDASCKRCTTASRWQHAMLARLEKAKLAEKVFVVPEFETEVSGKEALAEFTQSLWRLGQSKTRSASQPQKRRLSPSPNTRKSPLRKRPRKKV
jgi:arsenite-transporting ATPase